MIESVTEQAPANLSTTKAGNPFYYMRPLVAFALIFFLISLGDAIMSYSSPIFLEKALGSATLMGLVLGASSIVGFFADLFMSEWFRGKSYKFFLFWTLVFAFSFPVIFLFLPPIIIFFLLAMAVWGIYYEMMQFSNYHFINRQIKRQNRTFAWSLFMAFKSLGYTLGPIIAGLLIDRHMSQAFIAAFGFFAIAAFGALLFMKVQKMKRHENHAQAEEPYEEKKSVWHVIKVWVVLGKKIWPLFIFTFMLFLVDSTFWSIGTVLAEKLHVEHGVQGELLLTVYTIPSLFVGLLASIAAAPFGKKRGAYIAGLTSGLVLALLGFVENPYVIFGVAFVSAIFSSLAFPLISSTYADYVDRLDNLGNDLIGLQGAAHSMSYVVGPIIAGFLADRVGDQLTFTMMGIALAITAILMILLTPRKIRMPLKALHSV
ncbi:MAG: MFS transporter [Candidatus Dojkabacteria bacterium]|nr:MAG: MFS transporter [Candidatus Dojkabacteria bacterium]